MPAISTPAPAIDTGGAYRAPHRRQDPAVDPREPWSGESSSRGSDHGWANCTMSAGADALAYQTAGRLELWGGDMRHTQGDLEGGTDLYDLRDAWAAHGETLTIRSGAGWGALVDAHVAGRAIVVQGSGDVPGAGTFTGGHACAIGPETRGSDGAWLWGDPLVTDWQWISPARIREWAEHWQGSIAFATSSTVATPPGPDHPPEPAPPPDCHSGAELAAMRDQAAAYAGALEVAIAGDELVGAWVDWIRAGPPRPADHWDRGAWSFVRWARSSEPYPVATARAALEAEPAWDGPAWRAMLWP